LCTCWPYAWDAGGGATEPAADDGDTAAEPTAAAGDDDDPTDTEIKACAYDSRLYGSLTDFAKNLLGHRVDFCGPYWGTHHDELEALPNDQLDAICRGSACLNSRSSDCYGACDSDSCSSDGDGGQDDGDCDSGSSSSDGGGGQDDTDSGSGSSGDAAAA
jgi:hypothetical protein